MNMGNKIQKIFEEIFLVILIGLNVFEIFNLLPSEAGFIKAIISMTGLGYVLYKASLSDLFFGNKQKIIDLLLLLSYFLLISNKIVQFSTELAFEAEYWGDFFAMIVQNQVNIEMISFYIGGIGIIIISLLVTVFIKVQGPSIISTIIGDKIYKLGSLRKFFTSFIIILGFYLMFFNLVMEWLTLVIDAPLIVLVLFIYIFKLHDLGKKMDSEVILFKIADSVESFVEKFVKLFHSRGTLFLGLSGLLVLHLFTDVGVFMLPHSFNSHNIYSAEFGEHHEPLLELFGTDKLIVQEKGGQILNLIGYIINALGLTFLMLFPAFMWYIIYINHTSESAESVMFPSFVIAFFYMFLVFFIFLPVFKITSILPNNSDIDSFYGVDIQTQSILTSSNSVIKYASIAFFVFFIVLILNSFNIIRAILFYLMSFFGIGFFGVYLFKFFLSLSSSYINGITIAFEYLTQGCASTVMNGYFIFFSGISLILLFIFYVGGYLSFLISVFKPE